MDGATLLRAPGGCLCEHLLRKSEKGTRPLPAPSELLSLVGPEMILKTVPDSHGLGELFHNTRNPAPTRPNTSGWRDLNSDSLTPRSGRMCMWV